MKIRLLLFSLVCMVLGTQMPVLRAIPKKFLSFDEIADKHKTNSLSVEEEVELLPEVITSSWYNPWWTTTKKDSTIITCSYILGSVHPANSPVESSGRSITVIKEVDEKAQKPVITRTPNPFGIATTLGLVGLGAWLYSMKK